MSRYQILNDGRKGRNKVGIFDNQEPAKYDGKEITRRCMTMQETCDRLNALEAERERLKSEMQYAILYIEAADHKAAHEVLTQALKGGGDE